MVTVMKKLILSISALIVAFIWICKTPGNLPNINSKSNKPISAENLKNNPDSLTNKLTTYEGLTK